MSSLSSSSTTFSCLRFLEFLAIVDFSDRDDALGLFCFPKALISSAVCFLRRAYSHFGVGASLMMRESCKLNESHQY